MAHRVEGARPLEWRLETIWGLRDAPPEPGEAIFVSLAPTLRPPPGPVTAETLASSPLARILAHVRWIAEQLPPGGELVVYCEPDAAAFLVPCLPDDYYPHLWAAVRTTPAEAGGALPHEHRTLLAFGRREPRFHHARVRIAYEYCPACGRTTKDYGGKKHLYDAYGTLMSDVWRDEVADPHDPLPPWVLDRVAGMLATPDRYRMRVLVLDEAIAPAEAPLPPALWPALLPPPPTPGVAGPVHPWHHPQGRLLCGDALSALARVPDASIDFAFADPPYNLAKPYESYADALETERYHRWCDAWLMELLRVLRPGGLLGVINLPQYAARHARLLLQHAEWQSWIAWDSMSLPVRHIMPSHYAILLVRKPGGALRLPGPADPADTTATQYRYCLRPACIARRDRRQATRPLGDLWHDVHRLKHNSLRWDHPCQLPPKLLRRLIALATWPGDTVLDPFNGIGTTTLVAQQMGRRFLGIEISSEYFEIAQQRHLALDRGEDPFARRDTVPRVKNNSVPRQPRQRYPVPKRQLQLEVKALAERLGRRPTREEVLAALPYPAEYWDRFFRSWSEVFGAVRATGMTDRPPPATNPETPRLAPETEG